MEEQKQRTKKDWKIFWVIFDVIFFGGCLIVSLIFADPKGTIIYYDGLYRTNRTFGLAFLIFPFVSLYIAIFIVRVIFWKKEFKGKQFICRLLVAVILCNPIFIMMIPGRPPGYVSYTRGFHERVKRHLEIEPVRKWLTALDESVYEESKSVRASDAFVPGSIQESITAVCPAFLEFFKTEEGFNCVRICTSGGGISTLAGVAIGPKEMPIPQTEPDSYNEEGYRIIGAFRIKLEDGAYVFHEF